MSLDVFKPANLEPSPPEILQVCRCAPQHELGRTQHRHPSRGTSDQAPRPHAQRPPGPKPKPYIIDPDLTHSIGQVAICGSAAGAIQNLSREQLSKVEILEANGLPPLNDLLFGSDVPTQVNLKSLTKTPSHSKSPTPHHPTPNPQPTPRNRTQMQTGITRSRERLIPASLPRYAPRAR